MSPDELRVLADRAVACKGWRWMPGMLAWRPDCPPLRLATDEVTEIALQDHGWLPDLTDPATLGCLLALVREAWADECAGDVYDEFAHSWFFKSRVRDGDGGGNVLVLGQFRSETEALVAALEAAP